MIETIIIRDKRDNQKDIILEEKELDKKMKEENKKYIKEKLKESFKKGDGIIL